MGGSACKATWSSAMRVATAGSVATRVALVARSLSTPGVWIAGGVAAGVVEGTTVERLAHALVTSTSTTVHGRPRRTMNPPLAKLNMLILSTEAASFMTRRSPINQGQCRDAGC